MKNLFKQHRNAIIILWGCFVAAFGVIELALRLIDKLTY